jgi:hypothetical protein
MGLTDADSVPAQIGCISTRQPLSNSGSEAALSQIRAWLSRCQSSHIECHQTLSGAPIDEASQPLPPLIIDVGPPTGRVPARLVHTMLDPLPLTGSWLALSPAWGDDAPQPASGSPQSLSPLADMPAAYATAIALTRALGQRYLWIESLCMMSLATDRAARAAEAARAFSRATLVLSACDARGAGDPLYRPRRYDACPAVAASLPLAPAAAEDAGGGGGGGRTHARGQGERVRLVYRAAPFRAAGELGVAGSWGARRGWSTPEWMLARRVLHFREPPRQVMAPRDRSGASTGGDGLVWMCRARAEEESGREADAVLPLRGAEVDGDSEPGGSPSLAARLDWQAVLIQHSHKAFALPRDRLDSLAGVAAEVSIARGDDEYLHGLFRFDLPADLLWTRHGTRDAEPPLHLVDESEAPPSFTPVSLAHPIAFPLRSPLFSSTTTLASLADTAPLTLHAYAGRVPAFWERLAHASSATASSWLARHGHPPTDAGFVLLKDPDNGIPRGAASDRRVGWAVLDDPAHALGEGSECDDGPPSPASVVSLNPRLVADPTPGVRSRPSFGAGGSGEDDVWFALMASAQVEWVATGVFFGLLLQQVNRPGDAGRRFRRIGVAGLTIVEEWIEMLDGEVVLV